MDDAFHLLIKQRLRSNETHRFRKEWIHDAVIWCRNQVQPIGRKATVYRALGTLPVFPTSTSVTRSTAAPKTTEYTPIFAVSRA